MPHTEFIAQGDVCLPVCLLNDGVVVRCSNIYRATSSAGKKRHKKRLWWFQQVVLPRLLYPVGRRQRWWRKRGPPEHLVFPTNYKLMTLQIFFSDDANCLHVRAVLSMNGATKRINMCVSLIPAQASPRPPTHPLPMLQEVASDYPDTM